MIEPNPILIRLYNNLIPFFDSIEVVDMGIGELNYAHYSLEKGDGKNAIEHYNNSIKYFEKGDFPYTRGFG